MIYHKIKINKLFTIKVFRIIISTITTIKISKANLKITKKANNILRPKTITKI